LLAQPEILISPLPVLVLPVPPPLLARHPLLLLSLRRARMRLGSGRGRVRPIDVHVHHLRGSGEASKHADVPKTSRTRKEGKFTHQLADWEHGERPQGRVVATPRPEVDGAPRPGGRVVPREEVRQQPDSANAMGFASSSISKMRSRLSIRGTIRQWWRLERTHPRGQPAIRQVLQRGQE
jgi:hypothetical protein